MCNECNEVEANHNPIERKKIRSAPQGRCVLCDDHLSGSALVFAGVNPDGTGRLAHRHCWDNMRDHLWLSYGVDLDLLSEQEWVARQAGRPKLGMTPVFLDTGSIPAVANEAVLTPNLEAELNMLRAKLEAYLNKL